MLAKINIFLRAEQIISAKKPLSLHFLSFKRENAQRFSLLVNLDLAGGEAAA